MDYKARRRLCAATLDIIADMYGGDNWEEWSRDALVRTMDGWIDETLSARENAQTLVEDHSFDPRDCTDRLDRWVED